MQCRCGHNMAKTYSNPLKGYYEYYCYKCKRRLDLDDIVETWYVEEGSEADIDRMQAVVQLTRRDDYEPERCVTREDIKKRLAEWAKRAEGVTP